jgi:pyruvate formate lyase activating enzyme
MYKNGGITISGGEPLIHQKFCLKIAKICFDKNISLAFDTSGNSFSIENLNFFKKLITFKPLFLVDIKHTISEKHKLITGVEKIKEIELINFLEKNEVPY